MTIEDYRALPYERYLQTRRWIGTRNRILRLRGYRCERCTAGRNLQVHHLTYDRIGEERDDDLQVLCRGCHLGHHVAEATPNRSVYLSIVSAALKAEQFTSIADLTEDVKRRCAALKLPYDDGQVQAAISRLDDRRLNIQRKTVHSDLLEEGVGSAPMTRAEAAGWLARLGAIVKPMPTVPRWTRQQADRRIVLHHYADLIKDQIYRCAEAEAVVENQKP